MKKYLLLIFFVMFSHACSGKSPPVKSVLSPKEVANVLNEKSYTRKLRVITFEPMLEIALPYHYFLNLHQFTTLINWKFAGLNIDTTKDNVSSIRITGRIPVSAQSASEGDLFLIRSDHPKALTKEKIENFIHKNKVTVYHFDEDSLVYEEKKGDFMAWYYKYLPDQKAFLIFRSDWAPDLKKQSKKEIAFHLLTQVRMAKNLLSNQLLQPNYNWENLKKSLSTLEKKGLSQLQNQVKSQILSQNDKGTMIPQVNSDNTLFLLVFGKGKINEIIQGLQDHRVRYLLQESEDLPTDLTKDISKIPLEAHELKIHYQDKHGLVLQQERDAAANFFEYITVYSTQIDGKPILLFSQASHGSRYTEIYSEGMAMFYFYLFKHFHESF